MATNRTIAVSLNEDTEGTEFVVNNWPTSLDDAIAIWGEDVVWSMAERAGVIQAQGAWRNLQRRKNEPLTDRKATEAMKDWRPSSERKRLDPVEKTKRLIEKSGMTKEQLQELLKNL